MVIQKYDSDYKLRPGVYIKTLVVPSNNVDTTVNGSVAIGTDMDWGAEGELIEIKQTEYFEGAYKSKIGYAISDTQKVLPFTLPMSNCGTGYFYRLNKGGAKASATLDTITINAKYAGIVGNNISLTVTKDRPVVGKYTIDVYVDNAKAEKITLQNADDLKNATSEWVDFVYDESLSDIPATAGLKLSGGSNGTTSPETINDFFNAVGFRQVDAFALNTEVVEYQTLLATWTMDQRENKMKGIRAVCIEQLVDSEGVISTHNQGYKTKDYDVTPGLFTLFVAGAEAGCPLNQSLASRTIDGAIDVINPVEDDIVEDLLTEGYFLLTYDVDGAVCIEEDNNTLITYTDAKPKDMRLNQAVRVLDFISYKTAFIFAKQYAGKFTNTEIARTQFRSDILAGVYDYLYKLGAIEAYDSEADVVISKKDATSALLTEFFTIGQAWTKLFVINNLKF